MDEDGALEPIRTSRLVLVPMTSAFVEALVEGDRGRASALVGADVGRWLAANTAHVVQLALALSTADPATPRDGGRVMVRGDRAGRRQVIGTVGFHGAPDERGRVEVGCTIHPAYRGRGYAGEAMTAMFEWAAAHLGVTRFLVAVLPAGEAGPHLVTELDVIASGAANEAVPAAGATARLCRPLSFHGWAPTRPPRANKGRRTTNGGGGRS